jgi:hypothetical protein
MRECEAGSHPTTTRKKERRRGGKEWAGLKKWTGLADNGNVIKVVAVIKTEQWTMSIKNDVRVLYILFGRRPSER